MNLYFDIGGTNFRYYIYSNDNKNLIKYATYKRNSDVIHQLYNFIKNLFIFYKFISIKVSIAGYVKNNYIYGVNNAGIKDGTKLYTNFNNICIEYLNDGDAFIIGEIVYNKINDKKKNILAIIFGTGVGSGLIIDGKIVLNSEIFLYIEEYMKKNYLTNDNIDIVTTFLANELKKLVCLLNLDYIIINGYVNKFENFNNLITKKINLSSYYYTKIIFSDNEIPNIMGLISKENYI